MFVILIYTIIWIALHTDITMIHYLIVLFRLEYLKNLSFMFS